jgi:hypothetical protein
MAPTRVWQAGCLDRNADYKQQQRISITTPPEERQAQPSLPEFAPPGRDENGKRRFLPLLNSTMNIGNRPWP